MSKQSNYIKEKYKRTKKKSLIVYFILRFLIIVCMTTAILRKEWNSAILCLLSLALFIIPTFIEDKLHIDLPSVLEIIIYLFISLITTKKWCNIWRNTCYNII